MRARIMLAKPSFYARVVEPVTARELGDLLSDVDFFHAYTTFCFAFGAEIFNHNLLPRESFDLLF
jgi:hypothetical protein